MHSSAAVRARSDGRTSGEPVEATSAQAGLRIFVMVCRWLPSLAGWSAGETDRVR